MLTLALNEHGDIVHIKDAERGIFYKCPDCKEEVFAKKGETNAHHFCHKNSEDCGSHGESVVHKYYKQYIANLKEVEYMGATMQVTHSYMEKQLTQGLVADVVLILDGWKTIAVEICYQHAKDEAHIEKYKELNLECYEVYVDMDEDRTKFEIINFKCLSSIEIIKEELVECCNKKFDAEIRALKHQFLEQTKQFKDEIKKNKSEIQQKEREMRHLITDKKLIEWTGYSSNQLSQVYKNSKGEKFYFLEMCNIIDGYLYNEREETTKIKLYVKQILGYDGNEGIIYNIQFIGKNNNVIDVMDDVVSTKIGKNILINVYSMQEYGLQCGARRDRFNFGKKRF